MLRVSKNIALYYLTLFFLLVSLISVQAQISRLTKVCKKEIKYEYPTPDGWIENKCLDKKRKEHWIVYSDRDNNVTYKDPYAQYPHKKIPFLQACYVVDEKNDFLKLVKYDEGIVPPRKGLIPSILKKEKRFRPEDPKKVEFIGWVPRSKLLLNSNAWVSKDNLKPLRYTLDIGNKSSLIEREKRMNIDTIKVFRNPELTITGESKDIIPSIGDIAYVYKKSEDEKKSLIGFTPSFNGEDYSAMYGWIHSDLVLDFGQQQILVPKENKEKELAKILYGKDLTTVKEHEKGYKGDSLLQRGSTVIGIHDEFDFLPNLNKQSEKSGPSGQDYHSTYLPQPVWDHSPNKVINIDGEFLYFNEFEAFKKETKKMNIVVLVEDSPLLQQQLLYLTNSLQKLYGILRKKELDGYQSKLGAIVYNSSDIQGVYPLGGSFPGWLDFIKDTADNANHKNTVVQYASNHFDSQSAFGLERGLVQGTKMLASAKPNETNVFIVVGATTSSYKDLAMDILVDSLSSCSPRLLFYQLQNQNQESYSNFIFKAKNLIFGIKEEYDEKIRKYIVDSKLLKEGFNFERIDESRNIYLLDPKKGMYQGGIAFPTANKTLHPYTFDQLFERLLLEIVEQNKEKEKSLQEFFDGVGKTRSETHLDLWTYYERMKIDQAGIDSLTAEGYEDIYRKEFFTSEEKASEGFDHYYLLSEQEHESYVNHLKRLIPVPPVVMKPKFRRKLYRSHKRTYKELNKSFCKKEKAKKLFLSNLIYMGTGIAPNDIESMNITLKDIKKYRDCKSCERMTDKDLRAFLQKMREKIVAFEEYPILHQDQSHKIHTLKYVYIPELIMP